MISTSYQGVPINDQYLLSGGTDQSVTPIRGYRPISNSYQGVPINDQYLLSGVTYQFSVFNRENLTLFTLPASPSICPACNTHRDPCWSKRVQNTGKGRNMNKTQQRLLTSLINSELYLSSAQSNQWAFCSPWKCKQMVFDLTRADAQSQPGFPLAYLGGEFFLQCITDCFYYLSNNIPRWWAPLVTMTTPPK